MIENFKRAQQGRLENLCCDAGVGEPELLSDTLSMLLEGARVSKLASGSEGPSMRFVRACEATIASFRQPAAMLDLPHHNQAGIPNAGFWSPA